MQLTQDTLLAILAAVLIADVLVVLIALVWTQVQRRRHADITRYPSAGPRSMAPAPMAPATAPAPSAPATMSQYAPEATMSLSPSTAGSLGRADGPSEATPAEPVATPVAAAPSAATGTTAEIAPPNDPNADPLTGLLQAPAWSRVIADEEARIRRYHRPATIAFIEIVGLDRLTSRLGPSSVERIVPAVADTLRRNARQADHVARLAPGRFAILLPETDEILAINYIERVRRACDLWLESGAVSLRLAIGWSSSGGDGSLTDVESIAMDRMYAEARRLTRVAPTEG